MTSSRTPMQLISVLTLLLFLPAVLMAQGPVVTPSELREAVRNASEQKQKDLEQVRSFFADPHVKDALAKSGIRYEQVQKVVSSLDADAVAKLASQTSKIQTDFAAGSLTNQQLTYVVIALATAVIVIIAVKA
jgi:hypothetical protein